MTRNTLTLGFKKSKKDDSNKISSSGLELLAERQRLLKEAQNKKNNTQKSLSQKYPQKEKEKNITNFPNKESINIKENIEINNKLNIDDKTEPKLELNEKNEKNEKNNYKKDYRNNFNRKNNKDYRKNNFSNKTGYKKTDNIKKTPSDNKQDEKKVDIITNIEQPKFSINKKSPYKDSKSKFTKETFKEEDKIEKLDKKISKNKDDKYSKNIHTYIFSEDNNDEGVNDLLYNINKNNRLKRKEKKNIKNYSQQKIFQIVNIPEFISISDLAERMNEKKSDIIKKLLNMGMKTTANQIIDADTAELIVVEFGHTPNRVLDSDIENVLNKNKGTNFVPRSPIVTVMGHVDHGKTSLLDALRTTKVAEGESGGITQHIGASRIEFSKGKFITFIDTPGHEAFTEMRMRGANITDIVILVVAADDGVKNQTIEAINHTKAAKVPIIVAVNKIDKIGVNPEKVKQELLQYDVIAEEYGGNVIFVDVSAKNRINLDKLIEAIILQAEMLDLKAPIDCNACGAVIESKMDTQKGVTATILIQNGILKIGDIILAGTSYGKIKKMVDDKKKSQEQAKPSMAVEVLGLNSTPSAGVPFNVVSTEKEARDIISYRENKDREAKEAKRAGKSLESMLQHVKGSNKKQLSIIVKADVSGSIEAINSSLVKLNTEEVVIDIIHSATGSITESDVNLAAASNGLIIAFNVRAANIIKDLAKEKDIEIKYYSIIYDILDEIKAIMSGLLEPIIKDKVIGQAEIRNVIKISNIGKIAGCYVIDGEIHRNANARLIRDGVVIFDSKIKTLKRFKEDVKEVKNNYECGIAIENYDDIKEKDIIECYEKTEEKRKL